MDEASKQVEPDAEDDLTEAVEDDKSEVQQNFDRAIAELNGLDVGGPESDGSTTTSTPANGRSAADQIWNIPVEINVLIGSVELTIDRLMSLEIDDVIELEKNLDEPLDITVNGSTVARGEITMVSDDDNQFAIRVTELLSR